MPEKNVVGNLLWKPTSLVSNRMETFPYDYHPVMHAQCYLWWPSFGKMFRCHIVCLVSNTMGFFYPCIALWKGVVWWRPCFLHTSTIEICDCLYKDCATFITLHLEVMLGFDLNCLAFWQVELSYRQEKSWISLCGFHYQTMVLWKIFCIEIIDKNPVCYPMYIDVCSPYWLADFYSD